MNFYNDIEPYAASWMRNLIAAGHLPPGHVSETSIIDLDPADALLYDNAHFFAGIGGWPLALRLACWPEHIRTWTGSCPCQPFSAAGKQKGTEDERHLWPYFRKLIAIGRPAVVFGEQVASKLGREWLSGVRADLEALGYRFAAADLCAAGVGAPHIRQRLYWVAYSEYAKRGTELQEDENAYRWNGSGGGCDLSGLDNPYSQRRGQQRASDDLNRNLTHWADSNGSNALSGLGDTNNKGPQGLGERWDSTGERPSGPAGLGFWGNYDIIPCRDGKTRRIESGTFPLAHGVPARVGKLRAYGNAIVPQVAATFIKSVMEVINI